VPRVYCRWGCHIYIEYSGQNGLLEFLVANDYVCFDTVHLVVPRNDADMLGDYSVVNAVHLSSGRMAYKGFPLFINRDIESYERFFQGQRPKRMNVQTDLFCIHKGALVEFSDYFKGQNEALNRGKFS